MIDRGPMPTLNPFSGKPSENSEAEDVELDERQTVVAWEFLCLLDLGFTIEQAMRLVVIPNFSWHTADDLLKKGWPIEVVFDELT